MKTTKKQNSLFSKRRGVSPILATVILLGIAVVGGGLAFAVFSSGITTASQNNVIAIENAQAVKGTDHADITATVKNAGGKPWSSIQMTVAKTELSEPILYESLHENVAGCDDGISGTPAAGDCDDDDKNVADNRANPMRAQWLITLDKASGTDDQADFGEGAAVGRKLVFDDKDDNRTIQILNGTAVARLFGQSSSDNSHSLNSDMTVCDVSSSQANCIATFQELDSSTDGEAIYCDPGTDAQKAAGIFATCKVFTHTNIADDPISSGESVYFYADAFVKEITGLNNQVLRVGDNVVVNIASEDVDGGTARVQTIIKVTGS
ncbi:MAG: hypothetical protein GWN01_03635 [Nitrosopumilaceae archaeon]|nr:hypothetical protein [Nitrosopumilaceae archaeon]NIU00050.1 hypothetical protein [Nitrosopumilaceae archaeon]NIU86429.1 hypothetical protein [Nitrosopumilaceae archaeon]NIV65138.1 hypothetical protein [Nitrosopumilaceae archaeon]NIX60652.1 hypothetical protein [Nitrosopumilaceae archaeon]